MFFFIFKRFYLFIFRERGREGERDGGKYQCVVASHMTPTGELAHNPSMWPEWDSNKQPFGSQACTQPTEPHQPGINVFLLRYKKSTLEDILSPDKLLILYGNNFE